MIKHILPLVPPCPLDLYVEPFAGGASLFFALPEKPVYSVLNDTRDELINYYRVVQTRAKELESVLSATLHSESDWRRAKKLSADVTADPLERAWATHTKIMQSFAQKGDTWARHHHGECERNCGLRMESAKRLQGRVEISCEDAIKCICRRDKKHAFFFVDPPYPGSGRQTEWARYEQHDWNRLVETLDGIEGSYILSGYPNAVIPSDCEVFSLTRTSSASRGLPRKVTECLWRRLNSYHRGLVQGSLQIDLPQM